MALELNTLLVRGFIKIGPRVLRFLFVLSDLSPFLSLLLFFFFSAYFFTLPGLLMGRTKLIISGN